MATLTGAAHHVGFGGIRLETDWLWQPAVRFYLGIGYWVQNWKRSLCLADKIQIFEALARRDGFRVETPRIPGLGQQLDR